MKAHLQVIFTLDELAAYLKVGKRTLYRLAAGKFRLSRWAGRGGFVQSEIDQCINDQTRAGAKKEVMRKREQRSHPTARVAWAHCPSQQAKGLVSFFNFFWRCQMDMISKLAPGTGSRQAAKSSRPSLPCGAAP
jgi:predicted DNA-binding transcriptional regulator AlpA